MADTRGFVIVNVQSGEQRVFDFPSGAFRVVQCAVNKLEHPIITRSIVYVMSDRSVCWDFVVPISYTCMTFANNNLLASV